MLFYIEEVKEEYKNQMPPYPIEIYNRLKKYEGRDITSIEYNRPTPETVETIIISIDDCEITVDRRYIVQRNKYQELWLNLFGVIDISYEEMKLMK